MYFLSVRQTEPEEKCVGSLRSLPIIQDQKDILAQTWVNFVTNTIHTTIFHRTTTCPRKEALVIHCWSQQQPIYIEWVVWHWLLSAALVAFSTSRYSLERCYVKIHVPSTSLLATFAIFSSSTLYSTRTYLKLVLMFTILRRAISLSFSSFD